jgi:hypothetical protein
MLVCDFCSIPSLHEIAQCRCFHSFCDQCSNVTCSDDPNFTICNFCPKCSVECEISNYEAAVELAKAMEEEEKAQLPPPPPPVPQPPTEFVCPITRDLMTDPVVLSDGFSYDRSSIVEWMRSRMISPMTGAPIANAVMPNIVLRVMINDWKEKHGV